MEFALYTIKRLSNVGTSKKNARFFAEMISCHPNSKMEIYENCVDRNILKFDIGNVDNAEEVPVSNQLSFSETLESLLETTLSWYYLTTHSGKIALSSGISNRKIHNQLKCEVY